MKNYEFDLSDFRIKVGTVSSSKLCEIIVTQRYFGMMKEEAIVCMMELSRRRLLGDDFRYEEEIQKVLNTLPKFKLDMNSILKFKGFL